VLPLNPLLPGMGREAASEAGGGGGVRSGGSPAAGPLHQPAVTGASQPKSSNDPPAAGDLDPPRSPPHVGEDLRLADPERELAVAYALPARQPALRTLFLLDERFGQIVSSTAEPMIGLMRLAWWREALEKLDQGAAPAEPLLQAVGSRLLCRGIAGAALAEIEDGWAALLDGEPDQTAIVRHGARRGGVLFTLGALIVGAEDLQLGAAGELWALGDLAHRHSSPGARMEARALARPLAAWFSSVRWSKPARPLAMLAALAARDVFSDTRRRQGSPIRLLRMLAMHLTGR
jgi:15-cis-phytoene synthase